MRGEGATKEAWAGLAPGDVVAGTYRVTRILGHGGMGIVAEAVHEREKHRVAIKVLRPSTEAAAEATARFLFEAKAAAQIKSAHVARVLDVSTLDGGAPYFVMEYLEGKDLEATIRASGPLAVATAVDYMLQACEALAEAHSAGIVHGDLKPSNLFLTKTPEGKTLVKLLDFGISKEANGSADSSPGTSGTRPVVGSPLYKAPEQMMRPARRVDLRADIWSLGIVLHEMLTGHMPFVGKSLAEVSAAIATDAPIPIRMQRASIPAKIEAAILRCLAKDPDQRFQNVGYLANELVLFGPPEGEQSIAQIALALARATNVTAAPPPLEGARSHFGVPTAPLMPRIPLAAAAPPEAGTGWFESTTPGMAAPSAAILSAVTAPPPAPTSATSAAPGLDRTAGWTESTMPGIPPPPSRAVPAGMPKLGRASSPRLDAVDPSGAPASKTEEGLPAFVPTFAIGDAIAEAMASPAKLEPSAEIVAKNPAPVAPVAPREPVAAPPAAAAPPPPSKPAPSTSPDGVSIDGSDLPTDALAPPTGAPTATRGRAIFLVSAVIVALVTAGALRTVTSKGKAAGDATTTKTAVDRPVEQKPMPSGEATQEVSAAPAIRRPSSLPATEPPAATTPTATQPTANHGEEPSAASRTATPHAPSPKAATKPVGSTGATSTTPAPSGTAAFGVSRE